MKKKLFFLCVTIGIFLTAARCDWGGAKLNSSLPVVWGTFGIPIIEISIDGEKQFVKLRSCDKFLLSINELGYEHLRDTTQVGSISRGDLFGNSYESPSYRVKNISIGPKGFSDIVVGCIYSQDDEKSTFVWNGPNHSVENYPKTSGELGRPFFAETSLLLDLGHDRIIIAGEKELRTKYGILLDTMKKFTLDSDGQRCLLKADSSIGPLRLEINTGATMNLIRTSLLQRDSAIAALVQKDYRGLQYLNMDLAIDAMTFDRQRMYLIEFDCGTESLDGCLGVDFLEDHLVYLDYPNKAVYVAP